MSSNKSNKTDARRSGADAQEPTLLNKLASMFSSNSSKPAEVKNDKRRSKAKKEAPVHEKQEECAAHFSLRTLMHPKCWFKGAHSKPAKAAAKGPAKVKAAHKASKDQDVHGEEASDAHDHEASVSHKGDGEVAEEEVSPRKVVTVTVVNKKQPAASAVASPEEAAPVPASKKKKHHLLSNPFPWMHKQERSGAAAAAAADKAPAAKAKGPAKSKSVANAPKANASKAVANAVAPVKALVHSAASGIKDATAPSADAVDADDDECCVPQPSVDECGCVDEDEEELPAQCEESESDKEEKEEEDCYVSEDECGCDA